ncbi:MAG: hypothetical protein V8R85_02500 [Frisingicoccus sp.]
MIYNNVLEAIQAAKDLARLDGTICGIFQRRCLENRGIYGFI